MRKSSPKRRDEDQGRSPIVLLTNWALTRFDCFQPTVLYPSRREVDTENIQAFDKLSGEVFSYKSRDEATGDYAQENMESRVCRYLFAVYSAGSF